MLLFKIEGKNKKGDYLMTITQNIIMNINGIVLLTFILIQVNRSPKNKEIGNRIFKSLLYVTIFMLVITMIVRVDGIVGRVYLAINEVANFLMFTYGPILASLWFIYAHYQLFNDLTRLKRFFWPLILINFVNIFFLIINQFTNFMYYIDSSNIFRRGPYHNLLKLFNVFLLVAVLVMVYKNKQRVNRRYFDSLSFFSFPPLITLFLHDSVAFTSFVLSGVVLSLVLVFMTIQNHNINVDYLTEAFNRRMLEMHLANKIANSRETKTFSTIMIDLDDFKQINDNYGHQEGDFALISTVSLIKSVISRDDLIARSGGDEFWIVLETDEEDKVKKVIRGLKTKFSEWNNINEKPYNLSFSYGYMVYDYNQGLNSDEFRVKIDEKMYEFKKLKYMNN